MRHDDHVPPRMRGNEPRHGAVDPRATSCQLSPPGGAHIARLLPEGAQPAWSGISSKCCSSHAPKWISRRSRSCGRRGRGPAMASAVAAARPDRKRRPAPPRQMRGQPPSRAVSLRSAGRSDQPTIARHGSVRAAPRRCGSWQVPFSTCGSPATTLTTNSARAASALVQPPLRLAEAPRQGILGHHRQADLVGDDHHRRGAAASPSNSAASAAAGSLPASKVVGEPHRRAIQQHHCRRGSPPAPGRPPAVPRRCASPRRAAAVAVDLRAHLVVVEPGGGEIDVQARPLPQALRQRRIFQRRRRREPGSQAVTSRPAPF